LRRRCGLRERQGQRGRITTPQYDRDEFVRLGPLEAEDSDLAAGAERAVDVSLRGDYLGVVHASIVAADNDKGLTAG
jgi:hypothetical protein